MAEKEITKAEHIKIHEVLHSNLDKLIADWIMCTSKLPSSSTVLELMEWSHQQTIDPIRADTKEPHKE